MLVRSLLSFGLFSALALATTTSEAASTSAATPTAVLTAGNATGPTCFWSNGTAASTKHLLPCKTSLGKDGVFACCPPQGANDLYPLDYPICTDNGLCQAGNSPFLARGGCTDKTGKSKSCPQYCNKSKKSGMTGLTNCQGRSPYFCCDDEHDAGMCNCSPPNGTAFQLEGTTPLFWKDLISKGGNATAGVAGASASGCGTVHLTTTTTVMAPPSDSTQPAATSTIIATPPKPSGSQAAASKAISSSNPAATNFVNFGLAALAAVGVAAL